MTELALSELLPVLGQGGPALVAVWLGYSLAKRTLADLCKTVPEALEVARTLAESVKRVADHGITVRHVRDTEDQGQE